MHKTIQIRNVPVEVHREMRVRAAKAGTTLSDFLLAEVERIAASPPIEELIEELQAQTRPDLSQTPAEVLRSERDSR